MYFHTDAISKTILHSHSQNMYILDSSSNSCHQQFTTKKEEGPIVPPCTVLPLPNSSCLSLQQELNSTSDATEKFSIQLSSPSDYHPLLTNVFFQSPQKLSVLSNPSFPSFSSTIAPFWFVEKRSPQRSQGAEKEYIFTFSPLLYP
jgi:hypothetical protein